MILLIKRMASWELLSQKKQSQINKDSIRKNCQPLDHDYKVRYKFMLNNNYSFKYEPPYSGPFGKAQCCTFSN